MTAQSVSRLSWGDKVLRPDLRNGGAQLPDSADGLRRFSPPKQFRARKAALVKDAVDSSAEDARVRMREVHVI